MVQEWFLGNLKRAKTQADNEFFFRSFEKQLAFFFFLLDGFGCQWISVTSAKSFCCTCRSSSLSQ